MQARHRNVARQAARGHEAERRGPVDPEPARGDAKRVTDERQPCEEQGRRSMALHGIQILEVLLRKQAAERIRGHAASRIARRGDRHCERSAVGVNVNVGEERSL
ncbi:MAG TPA: hypothetical protein VFT23_02805 [Burkholderiales bacterium]|nr:hypothetical protein [Burkholderiales bacterium]